MGLGLSVILCAGHIMRIKDHGYADEEETYSRRSGGGPWPLPEVPAELLDHLVKGPMTPSEVQDLFLSFQKAVIERTMAAEMNLHLGYRPARTSLKARPTSAMVPAAKPC